MILEVHGLDKNPGQFVQMWGKYVTDFDPSKHCLECLKGPREDLIHKGMVDRDDYQLRNDFRYFYLFAWGRGNRAETNVHLAVRPHPGAVASIGSMYGVTFTIRDAIALRIDRLPKGWMELGDEFTTCRNFQFGVQMFGYNSPAGTPSLNAVPSTEEEA